MVAELRFPYLLRQGQSDVSERGNPIQIRGIDHVVLRVSNLDDMLGFYCETIGCTVERRDDEIGLVQLRAGAGLIDLVPVDSKLGRAGGAPPGREARNMDHFCLRLEDFEADRVIAHLKRCGTTPGEVVPRFGAEGRGPSVYVQDPEGNTVELKGPPVA